jgi:hypothetical protein
MQKRACFGFCPVSPLWEKGGKGGGIQEEKVQTRVAEQNRGRTQAEIFEAWIPTLPKEQPDTKARS